MTVDDMELVRRFARDNSEEAFAALVSRHVNLVHSVAMREVRDAHLAEEVTQTVFILLARKAGSLSGGTVVSGWLCRTARFVSARALTLRRRRLEREQEAFMQSQLPDDPDSEDTWRQIEPLLEGAMGRLSEADHSAIVLRYFEGRNYRDVASSLGTTEAGAKMRVNRALVKLRTVLSRRGVVLPVTAIASAVSAHSVQAAPAGLSKSVFVTATQGAAVSSTLATLTQSSLKVMAWTKVKIAAAATVVLLLAVSTTIHAVMFYNSHHGGHRPPAFAGYATPEASIQSALWAGSTGDFNRFLDSCTDDMAARLRNKMAGKTDAEVREAAMTWANSLAGYKVHRKEVVSADEVHLHITAKPSPDGLRNGSVVVIMRKIDGTWKQAGDL